MAKNNRQRKQQKLHIVRIGETSATHQSNAKIISSFANYDNNTREIVESANKLFAGKRNTNDRKKIYWHSTGATVRMIRS